MTLALSEPYPDENERQQLHYPNFTVQAPARSDHYVTRPRRASVRGPVKALSIKSGKFASSPKSAARSEAEKAIKAHMCAGVAAAAARLNEIHFPRGVSSHLCASSAHSRGLDRARLRGAVARDVDGSVMGHAHACGCSLSLIGR